MFQDEGIGIQKTQTTTMKDNHRRHICNTLDFNAQSHGCDAFLCRSHHHAFAVIRVNRDASGLTQGG
eukprot:1154750-Pelagomonas_calceolata.AAC.6